MIHPNRPLRVIDSWAGEGTGETVYRTEDGAVWRDAPASYYSETATAPMVTGTLIGGVIFKERLK